MNGHQKLANAIIEQAVKDYRGALCKIKARRDSKAAVAEALEIERFFHSGIYAALTDIDPDYLISRLRKEAA